MSFKGDLLKAGVQTDGESWSFFNKGQMRLNERLLENLTVLTDNTAGDLTYSAADLLGGLILRDPNGAARSDTTPSASDIIDAIYDAKNNDAFIFSIRNDADAAETITLAGGTGVTIDGTATIAQNEIKEFLVVLNDVSSGNEAVTIYSLGTATY